jgi:4-amino-4-deoxy-L-arabinose transferase-like glycosyltransferase
MDIVSSGPRGGSGPRSSRRAELAGALGLIAVLVGFAVLFWPSLPVPYERDEGEYAYASDLLARGATPYRDVFVQKPPGIILLYRAVTAALGPAFESVHLAVLASYLLQLALIYLLGRRLAGPPAGLTAAAVLAAALMMPAYETQPANTEAFMILPTTAAMLGLQSLRERPGAWPAAWLGSCFGLAVLFKQVALFHGPHLALGLLLVDGRWRRRVGWLVLFGACSALPHLVCIGWFAARGALPDFLGGALLHNLEYASMNPEGNFAALLVRRLGAFGPFDVLLWVGSAVALGALAFRRERWALFLAGGWLAASVLGLSTSGYFRGHYLIQALPPLALTAALGIWLAGRRAGPALLAVLFAAWVIGRPWIFGMTVEQQVLRRYGYLRFVTSVDVGDYLRRAEGCSLFVLASEPQIYHYSGCRAVTPEVEMNPLFGGYPSSRRRQEETLAAIQRDLPDFIVLSLPGRGVPMFPSSDPWFYERVAELVHERYELAAVTVKNRLGIHEAKNVDPAATPLDLLVFRRKN